MCGHGRLSSKLTHVDDKFWNTGSETVIIKGWVLVGQLSAIEDDRPG